MRRLDSITDAVNMNLRKLWEMVRDREALRAAVLGVAESQTRLGDLTTTAVPSVLDLPPTPPPSQPSRSSQSTKLSSMNYTAASHFHIWQCIYVNPNLPVHLIPANPSPCVCSLCLQIHSYSWPEDRLICTFLKEVISCAKAQGKKEYIFNLRP